MTYNHLFYLGFLLPILIFFYYKSKKRKAIEKSLLGYKPSGLANTLAQHTKQMQFFESLAKKEK